MATSDLPKTLRPFAFHGVVFETTSGDDWLADCPFCGKRRAFAVNVKTTKWTCHSRASHCGKFGNATTFLRQVAEFAEQSTSDREWKIAAEDRGLPVSALKKWGMGLWPQTGKWVIPVRSITGEVTDLRTWTPGHKIMGTAGRNSCLWGIDRIKSAKHVWLCEGEWDGKALSWLLEHGRGEGVVTAVPGARVLKEEWVEALAGKKVTVCGDNDEDGDKMAEKVWAALGGKGVDFVNWPESLPEKYDLRDFIQARVKKPIAALKELNSLRSTKHRKMPFDSKNDSVAAITGERESDRTGSSALSLHDVFAQYDKYLKMTEDLRLALTTLFAVHTSTHWCGDPLWMFLVGAPGSGKTELLLSMHDAPDILYRSSVSSRELCSGFKCTNDPSLVPKMIGRCSIFKDWTEVLESHPTELQAVYNVLRGAFDGTVDRGYGNNVARQYVGTFHLLAGVTNKIHAHNGSSVGERFLKFQLKRPPIKSREDILWAAMYGVTKEKEKNDALRATAAEFLNRKIDPPDPRDCLSHEYAKRIAALANLVANIRSDVTWAQCGYEREVQFRPDIELPTRLAKQLVKLAMATCVIYDHSKIGPSEWEIVERVAMNTAYGYHMDVVEAIMGLGGKNVSLSDVEEVAGIPRFTLDRKVAGMSVLGIVQLHREKSAPGPGASSQMITLSPKIRRWWDEAGIEHEHTEENVAAARGITGFDKQEKVKK